MCLNPLKGYISERGYIIKVASAKSQFVREVDGLWKSFYNMEDHRQGDITEYIDIPCRVCEECYRQQRNEWTARATAEMQMHDKAIFVTFTYRDYNDGEKVLPPVAEMVTDDGEILTHQTLRYSDMQLFWKRLRKKFSDRNIRFLVCGEYGSRTFRPHYHAIIYGLGIDDFPDMTVHNKNSQGDYLYSSEELDRIWSNGYTLSSEADNGTIAYVAGYVTKKFTTMKSKEFYKTTNVVAPFVRSSNRPGLGRAWFDENLHTFDNEHDYRVLPATNLRSTPTTIYLTNNWRLAYRNNLLADGSLEEIIDYEEKEKNRRVALLDNRDKLLATDASKEDMVSASKYNFKKSLEKKRGVY